MSSDPKATCVTRDATTNTVRKASFTTGQDKQFTLYQPCYQKDILSNRCIIEISNYPWYKDTKKKKKIPVHQWDPHNKATWFETHTYSKYKSYLAS